MYKCQLVNFLLHWSSEFWDVGLPHFTQNLKQDLTSLPQWLQNILSPKARWVVTHMKMSPCWTQKILGMGPFQALSDNYRESAQSIDLCFEKLVCVLANWFVFWEIDLCFEKSIGVLGTNLCFGKLICDLGNCFVSWEIILCFGKLFCVLVNWFVIDPFGPP